MQQSSMHIPTPIPFPLPPECADILPSELLEIEKQFYLQLRRAQDGVAAPRAAFAASLEILSACMAEAPWIAPLCLQARELTPPPSVKLFSAWSDGMKMKFLKRLFSESWSLETCAANDRSQWMRILPEIGQSAVSALIIQEFLGGKIRRGALRDVPCDMYFYNELHEGVPFEITRGQFPVNAQIIPYREISREELLDVHHPKSEYARAARVPERYALLKQRFLIATGAMALAATSVLRNPVGEQRSSLSL